MTIKILILYERDKSWLIMIASITMKNFGNGVFAT